MTREQTISDIQFRYSKRICDKETKSSWIYILLLKAKFYIYNDFVIFLSTDIMELQNVKFTDPFLFIKEFKKGILETLDTLENSWWELNY